jgi:hypothetical protein
VNIEARNKVNNKKMTISIADLHRCNNPLIDFELFLKNFNRSGPALFPEIGHRAAQQIAENTPRY